MAEQVRDGNLSERVPAGLEVDEIARLGLSFNNMLDELTRSREQLVQANMQIDRRREFTEAALGGVHYAAGNLAASAASFTAAARCKSHPCDHRHTRARSHNDAGSG
mgnify:CR=1 FL=1